MHSDRDPRNHRLALVSVREQFPSINTLSRTAVNQGIGPQFYVDGNGTAFKLIDIDPRRLTWHASFLNGIAFGIENGEHR